MRNVMVRYGLLVLLLALTLTPTITMVHAAPAYTIARDDFGVDLGDFQTQAQITYPMGVAGPFPTVLLIAGSGAYDRDFTIRDFTTGQVKSAIFRDIAEALTRRGYAVVRYNKHYLSDVSDPQQVRDFYQKFTLPLLLSDAEKVYTAMRHRAQVDANRTFLYGWSEGSTIATQLALMHPESAGLILQGPVSGSWRDIFRYQDQDVAVRFLRERVDTDKNGTITLDEERAAFGKYSGSTVIGSVALVTLDLSSPMTPKLNPAIDTNGDGALDIEGEIIPYLDRFFAGFDQDPGVFGPQYTASKALPPIVDTIHGYTAPVLILQGENDANVPPDGARQIDAVLATAGNRAHTLRTYPGLGHSLGPASDVDDDAFRPIARVPLTDLADWLDRNAGTGTDGTLLPATGMVRGQRPDGRWLALAVGCMLLGFGLTFRCLPMHARARR